MSDNKDKTPHRLKLDKRFLQVKTALSSLTAAVLALETSVAMDTIRRAFEQEGAFPGADWMESFSRETLYNDMEKLTKIMRRHQRLTEGELIIPAVITWIDELLMEANDERVSRYDSE